MKSLSTPERYIDATPEPKRSDLKELHALIRKTLPTLEPAVGSGMIGYGKYHYRYESGREGDTFRVALSANKTGISLYVCAVDDRGFLVEQAATKIGKASVGKSCIRFKKLSDLDLGALADVLARVRTARALGEVGAEAQPRAAARKKTPAVESGDGRSTRPKSSAAARSTKPRGARATKR